MLRRTIIQARSIAFALSLVACGCGDLIKQPYPAKSYFGIEPGLPEPTATTRPVNRQVLLVRGVRVSPPFDGSGFVYQMGLAQYATDYYINWIATPSALLTGGLASWLENTSSMQVITDGSTVRPDFVMDTEVTRMEIDRTDPGRAHAVLIAHFFLSHEEPSAMQVVSDTSYSARAAASTNDPQSYAAAMGEAYRQVLEHLATDLQSATPKQ